jgi:DNA polymerase III delta prime subunit
MSIIKELFTEKFRPKSLAQLIAPERIKNELNKGLVQNLLLYGSAGTGKTSTLFILAEPHTTLYINASSERGIDTLRDKIGKFCSSISLEGGREKLKCVILDEIDGATPEFFNAFKASMEKYSNVSRFIASCNYIQKVPDAIQSRFNCISYDPVNNEEETFAIEEYKLRVGKILTAAKISYTEEILEKFIRNDFPDMRSLMNKIQSFYLQGITELNAKNFNINYDFVNLYKLCLAGVDKPYENYKHVVSEYASKIDDTMAAIGNDFIEYIKSKRDIAFSEDEVANIIEQIDRQWIVVYSCCNDHRVFMINADDKYQMAVEAIKHIFQAFGIWDGYFLSHFSLKSSIASIALVSLLLYILFLDLP